MPWVWSGETSKGSRLGLPKRQQPRKVRNFKIRLWHIGVARPTIAVDPRDSQTCRLCALDVVHVAVANVQNVMRLKPQAFQCFLEHKSIRFVGSQIGRAHV